MSWTPEAVRAEMDYRLERARTEAAARRYRESGRARSWRAWRRRSANRRAA